MFVSSTTRELQLYNYNRLELEEISFLCQRCAIQSEYLSILGAISTSLQERKGEYINTVAIYFLVLFSYIRYFCMEDTKEVYNKIRIF